MLATLSVRTLDEARGEGGGARDRPALGGQAPGLPGLPLELAGVLGQVLALRVKALIRVIAPEPDSAVRVVPAGPGHVRLRSGCMLTQAYEHVQDSNGMQACMRGNWQGNARSWCSSGICCGLVRHASQSAALLRQGLGYLMCY